MAQWRHEWVPLTPSAARQKNHGSTPGPGSKIAKMLKQAQKGGNSSGVKKTTPSPPSRGNTGASSKPSPSSDLDEAAKAIKAGDTARAVNLLTRAMNNAKGAERKAIQAKRAELTRRLMGR